MKSSKTVSIITAAYNAELFIEKSLNSVVKQSFRDWELIVVDDASNDGTVSIIKKIKNSNKEKSIILIELSKNVGPGISRNIAIEKSQGDYIAFLDSDDIWTKDKLKDHIFFMKKNKLVVSHASYGFIDENDKILDKSFIVSKEPVGYYEILKKPELGCLSTIFFQKKIGKYYMSDDRRKQDYFLWISILKDGHKSVGFDKIQSYYRIHANQLKKNYKLILNHYRFLINRVELNPFQAFYYTLHYSINSLIKYLI